MMTIFILPDEVLLTSMASAYLSTKERYRFMALCKAWLPLLKEVRTLQLNSSKLQRFIDDDKYRQCVLQMVGYKGLQRNTTISATTKLLLNKMWPTEVCSNPFQWEDEFPSIDLSIKHLYKLHRLRINSFEEIENMEDLDDAVFYSKHPLGPAQAAQDDECHQNTPLIKLRNICVIYSEDQNRYLSIETQIGRRTLSELHISTYEHRFDEKDLNLLRGLESVTVFLCPTVRDLSALSQCKRVSLLGVTTTCPDLSTLTNVKRVSITLPADNVDLVGMPDLTTLKDVTSLHVNNIINKSIDISIFRHVKQLDLSGKFVSLVGTPKPLGINQSWSFAGFHLKDLTGYGILRELTLDDCKCPEDLSMLGSVKNLTIRKCKQIKKYPEPCGTGQSWRFVDVNIENVDNMYKLKSLVLIECNEIERICIFKVRRLHIMRCKSLRKLLSLHDILQVRLVTNNVFCEIRGLYNIASLIIQGDQSVYANSLFEITSIHDIQSLEIRGYKYIRNMYGFRNIQSMSIVDCPGISDMAIFASVKTLSISGCPAICDLSPLKNIGTIHINGWVGVQSLEGMDNVVCGCKAPPHLMTERSKWFYAIPEQSPPHE